MQRVLSCAVVGVAISVWALRAQSPRQPPVFRAGVELVEVDVIVTDRDGRPVRGLGREDFLILEDGKPVEIATFDAIELPDAPATRPAVSDGHSGSVVASNLKALEGSIYLILLDDAGLTFSAGHFDRLRKTALALIEQLGPADQAAMMSRVGNKAYQVEFTTDRRRLTRALERFTLAGPKRYAEKLTDFIERASRQLGTIPHRRKVVALISEGEAIDPEEPEFQLAFDAARRANVAVYTFDPKFVGSVDRMIDAVSPEDWAGIRSGDNASVESLRTIAANTGGRATVRTNFLAEGVTRMVAENRSYYLLRYYSAAPRDGKFHTIAVRTRRPGLEVRSRPGFTSAKGPAKPRGQAPPALDVLAAAPIQTHGLDLRIVAVPVPTPERGGSAIAIVTEVAAADLDGAPAVELTALAVDMSGQVRARDDYKAAVASPAAGDARRLRIASRLDVRRGRYQVRVAARRTDGGASGSVFVEIDVPDFSRDLTLGGLTLASPGSRGVARRERIEAALPATPMATTEIPPGMQVSAVLPLRIAAKHQGKPLTVTARLLGPGASTEIHRAERSATPFAGRSGGSIEIPLDTAPLAPGDYRVRIEVSMRGSDPQAREISFSLQDVNSQLPTPTAQTPNSH